jgi:hypothetical protein
MATTATSPPPSRWILRTIRATFDVFSGRGWTRPVATRPCAKPSRRRGRWKGEWPALAPWLSSPGG